MALLVGVERGFITRGQGTTIYEDHALSGESRPLPTRLPPLPGRENRKTLPVLDNSTTAAIWLKHPSNAGTAQRAAVLNRDTPDEREIQKRSSRLGAPSNGLYRQTADSNFLYWHWSPDYGFYLNHPFDRME